LSSFATAVSARTLREAPSGRSEGTMSRRSTSAPALAKCAAMPAPISPAPMTAARRMPPASDAAPI